MDGAPLPGVDLACNAMYLSLVGESPEMYCPPGCTLQATTQGTIYVLDHVRRIGYPLQLPVASPAAPPPPAAAPVSTPIPVTVVASPQMQPPNPTADVPVHVEPPASLAQAALLYHNEESATLSQQQQPSYKRSRASSVESRTPSSSHMSWERRRHASPEPMQDPTALHAPDSRASHDRERVAPSHSDLTPPVSDYGLSITNSPQYCLIPPHPQWFTSLLKALQMTGRFVNCHKVFIYCYYCRTFFAAKPSAMWCHLSNPKTHRVQRQRVRGYMNSGMHLLNSQEERLRRVVTPEEILSVPSKHFQHADRIQRNKSAVFVPSCVQYETLLSHEHKRRIVRDGAPFAAKIAVREDLRESTPQSVLKEPPQMVGWRFLMEGLDLVECRCHKTDALLEEWTIQNHHKDKDGSR